jgi:hypothetical protein
MPSPRRNTVRVSRGAQDGRIDGGYRLDKRPRASMPYSLSGALFLAQPIPFVNEEDFRSPLGYQTSFTALAIRCGVDLRL